MRKIKRLTKLLSLLLALVILASCGGNSAHISEGTTSEKTTEEETTVLSEETVTESVAKFEIEAQRLSVKEKDIVLSLLFESKDEGLDALIHIDLYEGNVLISQAEASAVEGVSEYVIPCNEERLNGELSITVTASVQGCEKIESLELKMNGGVVQLTADGIRCVVNEMTVEEKANMVVGAQELVKENASGGTYAIHRLGIPSVTLNDGPVGVRYGRSVWYPSVINISSSWDVELAERVGASIGSDALSLGIDIVLAPGMNIQRNILGGRNFEYSSEDPILTAYIAAGYVNGIQSTGAGACIKHYAANNQETFRRTGSSNVTERALREVYLKAFEIVVKEAKPFTVMSSYNKLNGEYTSVDKELIFNILREEFGFDGFVMSDWGAVAGVVDNVNAINDVTMPGSTEFPAQVLAAYEEGTITLETLDTCCYNVLSVVVKSATFLGLEMDKGMDYSMSEEIAANAAADTVVLLKNESSSLPLASGSEVAVFGNGAVKTVYGGEGSSQITARKSVSIMKGIRQSDSLSVYGYSQNPFLDAQPHSASDSSINIEVTEEYAALTAAGASVALIVISRSSAEHSDRSGTKGDYLLNDTEYQMIQRVSTAFHAQGKDVIVVLNTGACIEVESWKDMADAIIWCGYAGQETGRAVEKVLTGEVNPSAKLTASWPVSFDSVPNSEYEAFPGTYLDVNYYEDIYVGYRYYTTFGVDVSYEFGYGLSYTTFEYSDFSIKKNADGTLTATVTVTNTGKVAGREIVQLYVSKPEATLEQASMELAGFGKTSLLAAGESEALTITVAEYALKSYDTENSLWFMDAGTYTFSVGASVNDIRGEMPVDYDERTVLQDVENRCIPDTEFERITKETYSKDTITRKENLALGKTTYSNHSESEIYADSFAVDGSYTTRWSGVGLNGSAHIWQIDLGQTYSIGEIKIIWESIYVPFTILVSNDGVDFTTVDIYAPNESMYNVLNLYGTEARYVRLNASSGNFVSIYELEIYEATEDDVGPGKNDEIKTNLALGKTATSTACENQIHIPANAVDGDYTTRWSSINVGEAWFLVDLGEVTDIGSLMMYLESAYVPYRIEYSTDGQNYSTIYNGATNELFVTIEDLDVSARYIRVYREGEGWFSIYELKVFDK